MLTVPQAAERVGRDPETVRRWIRLGKLRSQKVGTQHLIEEDDLEAVTAGQGPLAMPAAWNKTWTGEPQPDWVGLLAHSRSGH